MLQLFKNNILFYFAASVLNISVIIIVFFAIDSYKKVRNVTDRVVKQVDHRWRSTDMEIWCKEAYIINKNGFICPDIEYILQQRKDKE